MTTKAHELGDLMVINLDLRKAVLFLLLVMLVLIFKMMFT